MYSLLVRLIRKRSVALLAAVLFSIHPCVTEAVNAVSYREDIFVALFSLVSCLCLIQSGRRYPVSYTNNSAHSSLQEEKRRIVKRQNPYRIASLCRMKVYYALALISYLLALFSKETAIVTPLFILSYRIVFMREYPPPVHIVPEESGNSLLKPNGHRTFNSPKAEWVRDFVHYYLGYILISLFYLLVRFIFFKNPLEISAGYLMGSIAINFMTMIKILAAYVKLMFFPFHLSADYTIAPVLSVFDLSFITSIFFLAAVGVIIFRITRLPGRNQTQMNEMFLSHTAAQNPRIYGLFAVCFFVALLPVLNIVPIGHIMADRYLYLPAAGFCAVMGGLLLCKLSIQIPVDKQKTFPLHAQSMLSKYILLSLISIPCLFFTAKTLERNRDWHNEYTFWTTILREQPLNYDAHNNLGSYFYKQGNLDRAIGELEEAVRLKKNYPEGHNSLGTMYMDKGLIDKAIAEYVEAIKYKPIFPQAYYNLGNASIKKGLLDKSIAFFNKAISQGMYNPQVFNNLGSAYIKKEMPDEAIVQYQKALSVYNDYAEVHSNLGYVYTKKGDLDRAMSELREALRLEPNHANAHNNLGAVYCQKGLLDMAQQEFLAAIRYNPNNASAHKNIGMIYFTKGENQRAREHFIQMLTYDPNYLKDAGIYAILAQLGLIKK
ncbi:MAG: tetratricopeptide repeat protein [Candidatus Brocadia sp.]|nr:tetratricopeptide repeat protein [Candidatus Brocadia sp.]